MQRASTPLFRRIKRYRSLYLLLLPAIGYYLVYRYYPILIQTALSFKTFNLSGGVWGSPWVGLANFRELIGSAQFGRLLRNTLVISVLRIGFGFLPPIVLAILLYDLRSNLLRRVSQTLVYIPHFFSWVIVYSIVFSLFSNSGLVNGVITGLGGESANFLLSSRWFYPLLIGSAVWKNVGWGTIIYLAALTAIDPQLFEAAKIDGAGPLSRIRHITLPGILPVMVFLLTLSVGQIFQQAGAEQILLFYSPATYEVADIIDTWVFRVGLSQLKYSLGAAAAFFQASIGLVLILLVNRLSVRLAGVGIW